MTERRITSEQARRPGGSLWSQDVLVAALITVIAVAIIGATWWRPNPTAAVHVDASAGDSEQKR